MGDTKKKAEPRATINGFQIQPRTFGRLTVVASTLTTGGLPPEAFKATGGRKWSTKPDPARQSRD